MISVGDVGILLNLVEVWFSIIERQTIHCGSFTSARELMIMDSAFINGWNDRCQPFIWTILSTRTSTISHRTRARL